MLRPHPNTTPPPAAAGGLVLTCGDPACRHTFQPQPTVLATGSLACPACDGWTFTAQLAEPTAAPVGPALTASALLSGLVSHGKTAQRHPAPADLDRPVPYWPTGRTAGEVRRDG